MKKWFACMLALAISALLCGCGEKEPPDTPQGETHTLSFLTAEGTEIVNAEGENVKLRGVNAGGLGVIEGWMTGFRTEGAAPADGTAGGEIRMRDHISATRILIERFGYDRAEALWYNYRHYWWGEQDFVNCADMGLNVIRLPFTYMNVDFAAVQGLEYAGKSYDFDFLDSFVNAAEEHGLYTILDLHGAYGSQNGQDHSGEEIDSAADVDFYSNEQKLSLTEKLWGAIAEHFKDNPAVAGYDLLNEPGEKAGTTSKPHFDAMDRFYKAIRAKGDEHIVIFESCWGGDDIPMPAEYGWENCMYSFHHYTNCSQAGQEEEHLTSFLARMEDVDRKGFGVPVQMGEFTCYNSERQWEETLAALNERGWNWASWTYKVWGVMGWGVYNVGVYGETKVQIHTDTFEEIDAKLRALESAPNARPFVFASGNSLASVIRKYAPGGGTQ